MKTVALKNPNNGEFTMMQLSGFGSISEDDRSQYTSHSTFTDYQTTVDNTYATKVSLSNAETRINTLEESSVGIVDGGRASLVHVEAGSINGGSASL